MADMATQCYAGNAARGMSLIALHNGGGVGVSKSINGGFGMVLDGSERVDQILKMSMPWDVMVGVARRGWAGNPNSRQQSLNTINCTRVRTISPCPTWQMTVLCIKHWKISEIKLRRYRTK